MKVISDSAVSNYLLDSLDRQTILNVYIPLLVSGLTKFQQFPDAVPERTVRASTTEKSDSTHLFMPCILPETVGVKVISGGPSNSSKGLGFQGSISILDEFSGELLAVLNAKSLTAFRTALASTACMVKVFDPAMKNDDMTSLSVFGAGPQAFWHVILASKLYPNLKQVNIVSRRSESAKKLATELGKYVEQEIKSFSAADDEAVSQVKQSSLIFGCTPSTEAIIQAKYIDTDPKTTKFVSLIGSYKPHMIELDLQFLNSFYTGKNTKIIVDSKDHCLSEAGELIQGEIPETQLVSITEVYDDSRSSLKDARSSGGVFLQKLVGLSVMDIVVAKHLAEHVDGQVVENF